MQVLRDNLGDDWDEACATLMTEMRMYELECLRSHFQHIHLKKQEALLFCSAWKGDSLTLGNNSKE